MARKALTAGTLRALFAKSGNQCAFPGCTHELVTDRNLFVSQICHIEGASPEGPRYNATSNDEDRRSFGNLMLLCYRHHREIDHSTSTFSSDALKEIKAKHESSFSKDIFNVDQSVIFQIEQEMHLYWEDVKRIQSNEHVVPELAVDINLDKSPIELFNDAKKSVERIYELTHMLCTSDCELNDELKAVLKKLGYDPSAYNALKYYENPFELRNWELHNIGIPNVITDLYTVLLQLEIKYLEEYLKTHTNDETAKLRMKNLREQMKKHAQHAGYVD